MSSIAVYVGRDFVPWSPRDIEDGGLGGAETAAVRLAEGLAALGHETTVFATTEADRLHGVDFRPREAFDLGVPRDALICSREPELFDAPHAARVAMLWPHGTDGGLKITPERASRIDHVLAISHWQANALAETRPLVADRITVIRNGIHLPYFATAPDERRARVLVSSQPERGLDIALELWPDVRALVPEAELAYASAPVYARLPDLVPRLRPFRARLAELADQPGVVDLGPLSHPALAAVMCESMVWLHPSWSTVDGGPFHETSCIGAMEAQAAGLAVVASGWGALPETVRAGTLVEPDGAPGEPWRSRLVAAVVRGLTDPEAQATARRDGPDAARELSWSGVAERVSALVEGG